MKRARAKIALACDGIFVWLSGYADERADGKCNDRSGHDLPGPRRRREKMYSCHANQSRDHTRICSARGGAAVRDYHQKSAEQASVGNRRNRLSAKLQSGPIVPQGRCVILNHPTVPDEWLLGSYPWTQFPVVFWTYSGVLVQVPFTGQEQIRVGLTRRVSLLLHLS